MEFLFEFFFILFVVICYDCQLFLCTALHELPYHGLVIIFRYESADDQIIFTRAQSVIGQPFQEAFVIIRKAALLDICSVSNKGSILMITFLYIFFYIDRITDDQISGIGH